MPLVYYNIDASITEFFSNLSTSATRAQCDEFASKHFGGSIEPVPLQGVTSYTVTAGRDKIVQFREPISLLNMEMLALAKKVHPDVVASCTFHGFIGEPSSNALAIYVMNRLPGDNYISARASLANTTALQLTTMKSLARFFAQSWQMGKPANLDQADISVILEACSCRFDHISGTIPSRFLPAVTKVRNFLPTLFSGKYPLVLTHGDLNEMNILVDPGSGNITGIVDWAEASILPFGFTLFALDNALGSMHASGWKYFDNSDYLRREFWGIFRDLVGGLSDSEMELIRVARMAGTFIRYGSPYDSGLKGMAGVRDATDASLKYLDILIQEG
ncbi:Protein kinase-like domain protein [Metarhizium guizhouense ARSEF 977]|uniref:Protein kinase-like domain protein n=1 Tax=Metarhizium guizhouense (strain ARSEF 977) TaxID=1276136 RepID=A0A0B4GQI8_METGA|nr:Protein kinase-like domain protein [Metarhizium guizhouense ARSEF 977]